MDSQRVMMGKVRAVETREGGLDLVFDVARMRVTFPDPAIMRVRIAAVGEFGRRRSWAPVAADDAFDRVDVTVERGDGEVTARTADMTVRIDLDGGAVHPATVDGRRFAADLDPPCWFDDGDGPVRIRSRKGFAADDRVYGLGEDPGLLDRRGRRVTSWASDPPHGHGPRNEMMYQAMPIAMVARPGLASAVVIANTHRSRFDLGADDPAAWWFEADACELEYVVVLGPRPREVVERIGALLGRAPLPPRWALGYHQSRWSYESAERIREIADGFRTRRIPCDAIHFDIAYMRGYRVFTWDDEAFPDPAGLIGELGERGFRAVPIIDCGVKVDDGYEVYREGTAKDAFVRRADGEPFRKYVWPGLSVFPDFARDDVRGWWGDLHRTVVEAGVSGVWNDMNEPTVFEKPFEEGGGGIGTIDEDAPQGGEGERTTHAEVHNLYGLGMARACREGLERMDGDRRWFVLTRSGFAGIQRWSAVWTGDNHSWWQHLELGIAQLLSLGLCGVAFAGSDIGGFNGNADGELFARWMQFGALSPFARGHSCDGTRSHEPWEFGPEIESICREWLGLRYRLLPYLYGSFRDASARGLPVARPLFFEFPDDPECYVDHGEFLVGPSLLAAPVVRPGHRHRDVYLPPGPWYDWWTGGIVEGGRHVLADAPLERIPLFVRAGSVIPMGPVVQHSGETVGADLTLEVFPGPGEGAPTEVYEDDGETTAAARGIFAVTEVRVATVPDGGESVGRVVVTIGSRSGSWAPPERKICVRVHGIPAEASARNPGWRLDSGDGTMVMSFPDDAAGRDLTIELPTVDA